MSLCTVKVVSRALTCSNELSQQISGNCENFIIKLTPTSNTTGPFDVYLDGELVYSALTRQTFLNGVTVQCGCVTPTPTITKTVTPTNTSTIFITPTNTPTLSVTPTVTPTISVSPTITPTISNSPTNTPTSSITPTETKTSTPTSTPTITQTSSPTFTPTNTVTPSITQTNTPTSSITPSITQTVTQTITPSQTSNVFEIEIITQDGIYVISQDSNNLLIQQLLSTYNVSSGGTSCITSTYILSTTIYSSSPNWYNAHRFFTNIDLDIPFDGGNLWYSNTIDGCGGMVQIDNLGYTNNTYCAPCP